MNEPKVFDAKQLEAQLETKIKKEEGIKDEIMAEIKKIELEKPKTDVKKVAQMPFFEKHQKSLFFLLFISSLANGLCFLALLL